MQAFAQITIQAPIELVWRVLTDINRWPEWQANVSSAKFDGELKPTGVFFWRAGGMRVRSEIQEVTAPTSIRWVGQALGTTADHAWILDPDGDATEVVTSETLTGWMPDVVGVFHKRFLENSLKRMLADLKAEVERRVAAGADR